MRAHHWIAGVFVSFAVASAAAPVFAMDGIPHNGGGSGGSGPAPGAGQIYASVQSALANGALVLRDAVLGQLSHPAGGVNIWAFGHGGESRQTGNALATLKGDRDGALAGADISLGHDWRVGAAGGLMTSRFKAPAATSDATVQTWQAGLYGGGPVGPLRLAAGLGYESHRLDVHRTQITAGVADPYGAALRAQTTEAFGELAYPLSTGPVTWEPYVGGAWSDLHTDRFSEHGATSVIEGRPSDFRTASTDLGLRASGSEGAWTPWISTAWRHGLGDLSPRSALTMAGGQTQAPAAVRMEMAVVQEGASSGSGSSGGTAFTATGLPLPRDAGVVQAGLRWRLSHAADLGLVYDGVYGRGLQDQRLALRLTARF